MLIIGHNHVGGLENVGRKTRLFINLEGNGAGSTHSSGERAPWHPHVEGERGREGEVRSRQSGCNSKALSCISTPEHSPAGPNLWITDSIPIQMCQPQPGLTGGPAGLRELTVACDVNGEARPPQPVSEGDPSSPPPCNQQVIWTRHCSSRTVIPFICK